MISWKLKSWEEIKQGRGSIKSIDLDDLDKKVYQILCPYCQEVIGVSEFSKGLFHKTFCSSKCIKKFREAFNRRKNPRSLIGDFFRKTGDRRQ